MTSDAQPIKIWPTEAAYYYVAVGDETKALSLLEKSHDNMQLLWINVEPLFDPLRDDVRFNRLLEKIGFPN